MAELAASLADLVANVATLERYASGTERERHFHHGRIKNGKLFVAVKSNGRFSFAPSKFAGYKGNDTRHAEDLDNRDGGTTNIQITELAGDPYDLGDDGHEEIDLRFLDYCHKFVIEPSKHPRARRYWLIDNDNAQSFRIPEEVNVPDIYEGARQKIYVNKYERNPEARRLCIAHFGCRCFVCGFDFEQMFGARGKGYIHVHHLVPLATIGKRYRVDPVTDLRPVCPNCHAMLHQDPEVATDELRMQIERSRRGGC